MFNSFKENYANVLAPYAQRAHESKGRLKELSKDYIRDDFQRDRDRIIHSKPFRRLNGKTQVMVAPENDHIRTRLTHSLEVAQLARTLARALGLNEDLVEAISLAHDLGHAPFGHAGEDALNECLKDEGGFDHNDQTLRVVGIIGQSYDGGSSEYGLNLTTETMEGLLKHSGSTNTPSKVQSQFAKRYNIVMSKEGSIESQVAGIADELAYLPHDLEDGLRIGAFTAEDFINSSKNFKEMFSDQEKLTPTGLKRTLIDSAIKDIFEEAKKILETKTPSQLENLKREPELVIKFSKKVKDDMQDLRSFLERFYKDARVLKATKKGQNIIKEIFDHCVNSGCDGSFDGCSCSDLSKDHRKHITQNKSQKAARARDCIASMTDRFAKNTLKIIKKKNDRN